MCEAAILNEVTFEIYKLKTTLKSIFVSWDSKNLWSRDKPITYHENLMFQTVILSEDLFLMC